MSVVLPIPLEKFTSLTFVLKLWNTNIPCDRYIRVWDLREHNTPKS